jgi:hypothetical protein
VCVGGVVVVVVAEILKEFPTFVLRRGDSITADLICCSVLLLDFQHPWFRHKGGA